jgi:hypothetical protein
VFDEYRGIVSKAVVVIVVKRPCWREHSSRHPNQIVEPVAMAPASSQSLPAQSVASGPERGSGMDYNGPQDIKLVRG